MTIVDMNAAASRGFEAQALAHKRALDELEGLILWIGWSTYPLFDDGGDITITFANTAQLDESLVVVAGPESLDFDSHYRDMISGAGVRRHVR